MKKIKVFIVDDHEILRDGLKVLISLSKNIEIIGEASNGKEAVQSVAKCLPDIVLMDIVMPVMDGIEATLRITRTCPSVKVLILSQHLDQEYVLSSIKAGARGYILKKSLSSELIRGIEAVYNEGYYFNPSVARSVVEDYLKLAKNE